MNTHTIKRLVKQYGIPAVVGLATATLTMLFRHSEEDVELDIGSTEAEAEVSEIIEGEADEVSADTEEVTEG